MANKAVNTVFMRNLAFRSYSAAAQSEPSSSTSSGAKFSSTVLPNKMVVSTVDVNSPITRVSVISKAGSRYECPDTLGASHVMRIAAGLTTEGASHLAITRNLQKKGLSLTASSDRETIIYTLEGMRDAVEGSLRFLREVAARPEFRPWEVADNRHRIKYELKGITGPVKAVDLLHKAAFRTGLGNSIFCPKHQVGVISTENLESHFFNTCTTNRTAVAGYGISQQRLVTFAQELPLEGGDGIENKSPYSGGEIRKEVGGGLAHVAVGTLGASLKNAKEALAFAVLQRALGTGPYLKYGGSISPLYKAALAAAGDVPFAISAFNAEYSDAGLFGFVVSASPDIIENVVVESVKCLRGNPINEADINRAKHQLKVALLGTVESGFEYVENIAQQAVLTGSAQSAVDLAQTIDAITTEDVAAAAKRVSTTALSMASVGSLDNVPYLDNL